MSVNSKSSEAEGSYRYGNTRPYTVFALALSAAIGAVALVGVAWSSLDTATERHDLATPPDLKGVVEKTGIKGRALIDDVRRDFSESAPPEAEYTEIVSADETPTG